MIIPPLCLIGRCRDVTASASPVDMVILAFGVLLASEFRLDLEGVGTEVVSLRLEQVGRQILCPVTIVPTKCSAESRRRNTP